MIDDDDDLSIDDDGEVEELSYTEGGSPGVGAPDAGVEFEATPLAIEEKWEEEAVREHLRMVGSGLHELIGEAEKDWEMSRRDLDRIAPPLTRILNRYETTAKAAIYSDPLMLGYGTIMYASRSVLQARAARIEKREQEEGVLEEQAGYDVAGDEEDEDYQPGPSSGNSNGLRFPEAARRTRR